MAARRELKFDSLDDVIRDAEQLLARGYDRAGKWDLAQVCGHLADWLTYPVAGFPKAPLPVRVMLRLARATLGRRMFEKYMREGMAAGKPTMPQSVHPPGEDPAVAVARLREAVRTFRDHPGEYLPSPLFGRLDRGDATRLQLAHAAHHLSFLIPRQA